MTATLYDNEVKVFKFIELSINDQRCNRVTLKIFSQLSHKSLVESNKKIKQKYFQKKNMQSEI